MITAIEIENFKGIGKRQRIELRALTLLFGPNSAGKSTILHAIHYAREIFESRKLDADRTAIGGPFVDLGGFRSFVHNRDLSRAVSLAFEIQGEIGRDCHHFTRWLPGGQFPKPVDGRINALQETRVEISIKWSEVRKCPVVTAFRVWLDGSPIATIRDDVDKQNHRITDLNVEHPIFSVDEQGRIPGGAAEVLAAWSATAKLNPNDGSSRAIPFFSGHDGLLDWDEELDMYDEYAPHDPEKEAADEMVMALLSVLLLGPGQALRKELGGMIYLGPLRQTPPRDFSPPRMPTSDRWATGLAAWDKLFEAEDKFLNEVSAWLSDGDRLATGYRLERRRTAELDLASPLAISLQSLRAFDDSEDIAAKIRALPRRTTLRLVSVNSPGTLLDVEDVGEGIGQIIPVVTAALDHGLGTLLIEQPELHVHPRIQVGLADLFIQHALPRTVPISNGGSFLIEPEPVLVETHSEHLLLRILRRVRQTAEGTLPAGLPPVKPDDVAVLYVQPGPDGTEVTRLRVDEAGEFVDRWPGGFFEERAEELFR